MGSQSRKQSANEAIWNTTIGFCISMVISMCIAAPITQWWIDAGYSVSNPILWAIHTTMFTSISIGRNYVVRRFFNKRVK